MLQSRLAGRYKKAHRFNGGKAELSPESPGDDTKTCADHHRIMCPEGVACCHAACAHLESRALHFSTKDRANSIPDPDALARYVAGVAREKHIPLLIAGGTNNHLHLLIALPAAMPLAKAVQELKGNSSRWLNQHGRLFAWQEGYGAFSVSVSSKRAVIGYISEQFDIIRGAASSRSWRRCCGSRKSIAIRGSCLDRCAVPGGLGVPHSRTSHR